MTKRDLSRRQFLFASAMSAVGVTLAACGQAVPAPSAEAQPTAAQPTTAAAEQPAAAPSKYKEAPELAELVAEGKLPPIEERLPKNPLILTPVDGIGRYGGRMRQFSRDLGDYGFVLQQYGHSPLRYIDDALAIAPGTCETWETNADNTEWILHFREGLRWSDGELVSVDDILFWFEDMVKHPDVSEQADPMLQAGGKLCEMEKIDDLTLKMTFAVPAPFTYDRLAMRIKGAKPGPRWIAPKHYMSQFHPTYNPDATSLEEFEQQIHWQKGTGCPTLGHWMVSVFEPASRRETVRNPYYYAVDPEGNQLPYIDGTDEVLIEDPEVQKLTILQGGADYVTRHLHRVTLSDLSTMLAGEANGNFKVYFRDGGDGTGRIFYWNQDNPDEKLRTLYRDPRFKRAMSHGLDRATIQKVVYFNTGLLTTGTMSPKAIEFNVNDEGKQIFEEWRTAYIEFDPDKANALLDEIGLLDADGDGYREFADGSKLELRVDLSATASPDGLKVLEIAQQTWKDIGLNIIINQLPQAEFEQFWNAGQGSIRTDWEVGDGPNFWVYPSWIVPNEPSRWAPLAGNRMAVQGTPKENEEADASPWDRLPPRFNDSERELISEPVWRLQEIYLEAIVESDAMKRHQLAWEIARIHIDEGPFFIGCVANSPTLEFVSNKLMNVPTHSQLKTGGFTFPGIIPHPGVWDPETYSFTDTPVDKPHGLRPAS